jgi:hypothetical protein
VREIFSSYGDRFQVLSVNDIAVDDISEHLKDVDAVIHAAAPLPGKGDAKALLKVCVYWGDMPVLNNVLTNLFSQGAVDGSLNIIRQAEQAGIKRIIYTSSMATVFNPSGSLTDKGMIVQSR